MIDTVFKTVQTLINKENNGYLSPTEFNIIANTVQQEIFRGYFEDENRDKNKENRGLTNKGYANLDFNQRQRIDQFAEVIDVSKVSSNFPLPENLYIIEDDGIIRLIPDGEIFTEGNVIEEVERNKIGWLNKSLSAPSLTYPVYERYNEYIVVYPADISRVKLRYLRTPKFPNWTYIIINGKEIFDPSSSSYQDFELHESEFSNIVLRILSHFGLNLREEMVVQIAETLKQKQEVKDEN